jgi:ribonuclease R
MLMSLKHDIIYKLKKLKAATIKALLKEMDIATGEKREFKTALQTLIKEKKVLIGPNELLTLPSVMEDFIGTFKRLPSGHGIVQMPAKPDQETVEWFIKEEDTLSAITGDKVQINPVKSHFHRPEGKSDRAEIIKIAERTRKTFVGTYLLKNEVALVNVDGGLFEKFFELEATEVKLELKDRVWVEVLDFPQGKKRGKCKLLERLGEAGDINVEEKALLRDLEIREVFPAEVLAEAQKVAQEFQEIIHPGREDYTQDIVLTIDPPDAKDHDDAVSLTIDPKTQNRILTVHIADVAYFVSPGGALDNEARLRGTSVYLPQRSIPMFPELISAHVASLKEGVLRYVKTVRMEYNPQGTLLHTEFFNGAIRVLKRFNYGEIQQFIDGESVTWPSTIQKSVTEMHAFSRVLRKKRFERGSLEMQMPETRLSYNKEGEITGAYFTISQHSHQLIEEFMLAANEAVASHFRLQKAPFLRRIHPTPTEAKQNAFADFARDLGFEIKNPRNRFELQKVLDESAKTDHRQAIHFAFLRSLKQATYSPMIDGHYALASPDYCHFTSPIRRYPDLTVHRLLNQWIKNKRIAAKDDELATLGQWCSIRERKAEEAERGAIEIRMKDYVRQNVGKQLPGTITGMNDRGFFVQGIDLPVEGMVSLEDFPDVDFEYDAAAYTLRGRGSRLHFRLGNKVVVKIAGIDPERGKVRMTYVPERKAKAPAQP